MDDRVEAEVLEKAHAFVRKYGSKRAEAHGLLGPS